MGQDACAIKAWIISTEEPERGEPCVHCVSVIYEGGDLKLTLPIRGFEVSQDWYTTLSGNADVRQAVFDCVGMRFA